MFVGYVCGGYRGEVLRCISGVQGKCSWKFSWRLTGSEFLWWDMDSELLVLFSMLANIIQRREGKVHT